MKDLRQILHPSHIPECFFSALKEILKSTGARASDEGGKELARAVKEIARKIAERSKTLADHAGRKTITLSLTTPISSSLVFIAVPVQCAFNFRQQTSILS